MSSTFICRATPQREASGRRIMGKSRVYKIETKNGSITYRMPFSLGNSILWSTYPGLSLGTYYHLRDKLTLNLCTIFIERG